MVTGASAAAAALAAGGVGGGGGGVQPPADPEDTMVPDCSKASTPGVAQPTTSIRQLRQRDQMCGCKKERRLNGEEKIFKKILEKEIGLNQTTSEEVFRQGIHGFEAIGQHDEEGINHLVSMMMKNVSPHCVEPGKFFIQTLFQTKIALMSKWIEHQKMIGGDPTEVGWSGAQEDPMKASASRSDCYKKRSSSSDREPSDSLFPKPLKNIKCWNSFSEELEAYFQNKRGVTMVPLSCVIRPKDEETVSQADRDGKVGAFQKCADWDKHGRRCIALEGEHHQTDNQAVWAALSKLVRDGPGWSCIKGCEKRGSGDGRKACHVLERHCGTSHVVHNEAQTARSVTFRSTWDNSSTKWTLYDYSDERAKAKATLEKLHEPLAEKVCVQECLTGVSDDIIQLIGAKSIVRQDGSQFEKDFEATMNFFHSTWQSCDGTKGHNGKRNASSTHQGQPGDGKRRKHNPNFKPEAKSYPKEEWLKLSKEQRDAVIKLWKEAKQKKKAELESKRIVAAATANEQAGSAEGVAFEPDQRQDQAGNQFGRHAHQQ